MKKIYFAFIFSSSILSSQVNTEIHVFDILNDGRKYLLKNGKNISNNPGYDSQPYFYNDEQILFASTKKGNTDIAFYNLENNKKRFISDTPKGGEYSPQRIANSSQISAVRLDDSGLQRFYKYDKKSKKSTVLIIDLKVAYPAWYDKNTVVASVIVNDSLELFVCDLKTKQTFL